MQKPKINDFDNLFERFCIMAEQKDIGRQKALQMLKQNTTQSLFNQLEIKLYEIDKKENK